MKILHVIPSISKVRGGTSHALRMMECSLSAAGLSVATLTTDDDGPGLRLHREAQPPCPAGVERVYTGKRTEFYLFAPALAPWLHHHVRDFDVVHIHALFSFSSVAAAVMARLKNVPYVVQPHGMLNAYGVTQRRPWLKAASLKLIESRVLRHASAVHFTSQSEWDEAKTYGIPLRGVVIPLGFEAEALRSIDISTSNGSEDQQIILFLSRLDPKKNIEGLLRAFHIVRQSHSRAVLVIAGNGTLEYVASLHELAETVGVAEAIIWAGHVEGDRKRELFSSAKVFALPSFSENFGIAAVEAMLAGRSCAVARGVAVADEIGGAGAGLVTGTDPESIAIALNRLLGDAALRQEMGVRARDLVEREYSPRVMAGRLIELYSNIVGASNYNVDLIGP